MLKKGNTWAQPEYPRVTDEFPQGHWMRRTVASVKRRHHAEFLKLLKCRKRYPDRGRTP